MHHSRNLLSAKRKYLFGLLLLSFITLICVALLRQFALARVSKDDSDNFAILMLMDWNRFFLLCWKKSKKIRLFILLCYLSLLLLLNTFDAFVVKSLHRKRRNVLAFIVLNLFFPQITRIKQILTDFYLCSSVVSVSSVSQFTNR